MDAQSVILGARVAHVRELKSQVARLEAENSRLRDENAALSAHLSQAMLAAEDLRGGKAVEIWDGWNLILGADRAAHSREELVRRAAATGRRVWIVFDGPHESVREDGPVRVSYTGGTGEHRADKFICSFVRMAAYLGLADRVTVRTNDKDFLKTIERLKNLRERTA